MVYKIIVSPRAVKEIENAVEYYSLYSAKAPLHFIDEIKQCYLQLESNPFLRVRYNNIRSIGLKKFPFSLYYVINELRNSVRILSCFHDKRDPDSRP
jgi:toxin ParE1/3/4